MEELKPYPEYKKTTEPWLPTRPAHWPMVKLKHVLVERSEKGYPSEPLLAATQTKGVVLKTEYENRTVEAMKDLHNLKLVVPGDFVISLRSFQGGIEYARCRGIISPAYTILYPRDSSTHEYLAALFKSRPFIGNLTLYVTGIRQGQNVDYTKLSASFVPIPPPEERDAIVRFLAALDRRVNRFVRAKRRLIEVLTEQKQAILDQTVTPCESELVTLNAGGLPRPSVSVRDWRGFRVGQLIQSGWLEIQDGNHGELHPTAADYVESGIPFLMANGVRPTGLDLVNCAKLPEAKARALRIGFARSGDVLLTHKATIGQVCIVPQDVIYPFIMLTPQVTYYRLKTDVFCPEFLSLFMQSSHFQRQLKLLSLNQSTRNYIGLLEQRNLVLSFPERRQQQEIVRGAQSGMAPIERAIAPANREIALLREYRTRLVADVVTGKLDVRAAVEKLPKDETDSVEPQDASEDVDSGADLEAEMVPVVAEFEEGRHA